MSDPSPVINRLKTHSSGRPIVDWYLEEANNEVQLCAQVGDEDFTLLTISEGSLIIHTQHEGALAALGLRQGDTWGYGWNLPKMEDDEESKTIGYVRVVEDEGEE